MNSIFSVLLSLCYLLSRCRGAFVDNTRPRVDTDGVLMDVHDGNILHHAVQRNEEQEYLTCYQGFSEFCQGCYECDGLNLEVVMEQGRRYFKYK